MVASAAAAAVVFSFGLTGFGLTAVTAVIAGGSGGGARTPSLGMSHSTLGIGGGTRCHGGGWPIVTSYLAAGAGGGGIGGDFGI